MATVVSWVGQLASLGNKVAQNSLIAAALVTEPIVNVTFDEVAAVSKSWGALLCSCSKAILQTALSSLHRKDQILAPWFYDNYIVDLSPLLISCEWRVYNYPSWMPGAYPLAEALNKGPRDLISYEPMTSMHANICLWIHSARRSIPSQLMNNKYS